MQKIKTKINNCNMSILHKITRLKKRETIEIKIFFFIGNRFIPKCRLSGRSPVISTYLQRKYWDKTLSVKVSTTVTNHLITKYTQRIRTNIGQSKLYWTSKEYWTIITSSFITNIVWNIVIKCFSSTSLFIFIWL